MYSGLDEMWHVFVILFILCLVIIPFGLWKIVEIIIYLFNHVHWG